MTDSEQPAAPDAGTDRSTARRVAEYFNGSRDWDDLSDDERTGILTSKPTDGEPPWAASEGGGAVPPAELAAHDAALIAAAEARGAAEERERIAAEFHRLRGADILTDVRRIYIGPAEAGRFADYLARTAPATDRNEAGALTPPAQSGPVEAVLAAHISQDPTCEFCREVDDLHDYRAHVAAALAEAGIGSLAQARAEAWDEGYTACVDDGISTDSPNPYTARAAAQQAVPQEPTDPAWIFGDEAAARLIASVAWPFERVENRESWAPRLLSEPEMLEQEYRSALARLRSAYAKCHVAAAQQAGTVET